MPIPERIPMALDHYDLRRIGRYGDGHQFMAFVTGSLPTRPLAADWQRHKRWYAVLHRFDADGRHLGTDAWCGGTTADGEGLAIPAAERKLEQ